jgi:hypothetical protein
VLQDRVAQTFDRPGGQVPRAAVLSYALAVVFAGAAVSFGIFEGGGRNIAMGCLAAVFGFGLWIALGTHLALHAQIADRPRD